MLADPADILTSE